MKRTSGIWCILLVLLPILTQGLPWEDPFPALVRQWKMGTSPRSRRGLEDMDLCPVHPKPLPQEIINSFSVPATLKYAFNQLDQAVQQLIQNNSISALSVGVVYDQELIWGKGYGLLNPSDPTSKVSVDTPYRVGSITKALTTLMLLKLRDAGKVVLDDPVSKYVPQFRPKSPYKNNGGITWRSLSSQNSGLQGSIPCNFFTVLEPFLNDACDISNDEAWKRLNEQEVMAPMYSRPHYADSAYAIIGRALESVLPQGQTYEDYMVNEIFKPLGMSNSFFKLTSDMASKLPTGYAGKNAMPSYASQVPLNWAAPTGQAYSTVRDLQKFMSLFFLGNDAPENPISIFSSSLREMLQAVSVNDDAASAYGMPWEIYYSKSIGGGSSSYWINTKTGAIPGYTGTLLMIPSLKMGLILQVNNFGALTFAIPLFTSLIDAFERTFITYALPPPNPGNLTKYEGVYIATALLGSLSANLTIEALESEAMLVVYYTLGGQTMKLNTTWLGEGNTFRFHLVNEFTCLGMQAGMNDVFIYFQLNSWTGQVYSATVPGADPLYGWVFYKQSSLWGREDAIP